MKGLGTDDDRLCRVIVSRCEVDMVQIKEEFQKQYKQTLAMFIAVSIYISQQLTDNAVHVDAFFIVSSFILPLQS